MSVLSDGYEKVMERYEEVTNTTATSKNGKSDSSQRLLLASKVCLVFLSFEATFGFLSNSLSILSDALHMLCDFSSFAIAIYAVRMRDRVPGGRHSFGWGRGEVLAALTSVVLLWIVSLSLFFEAMERFVHEVSNSNKVDEVKGGMMSIVAAVGVAVNMILLWILGREGHVHLLGAGDCGHDHYQEGDVEMRKVVIDGCPPLDLSWTNVQSIHSCGDLSPTKNSRDKELLLHATSLHLIGDLLQSMAVLIAGLIIYIKPNWSIADPICTLISSAIVFLSTRNVVAVAASILMETCPERIDVNEVREKLEEGGIITSLHKLRIWAISTEDIHMNLHFSVEGGNANLKAAMSVLRTVKNEFGIDEVTPFFWVDGGPCPACQ